MVLKYVIDNCTLGHLFICSLYESAKITVALTCKYPTLLSFSMCFAYVIILELKLFDSIQEKSTLT